MDAAGEGDVAGGVCCEGVDDGTAGAGGDPAGLPWGSGCPGGAAAVASEDWNSPCWREMMPSTAYCRQKGSGLSATRPSTASWPAQWNVSVVAAAGQMAMSWGYSEIGLGGV